MNITNEKNKNLNYTQQKKTPNIRWMLVGYDLIVYAIVAVIRLVIYGGMDKLSSRKSSNYISSGIKENADSEE